MRSARWWHLTLGVVIISAFAVQIAIAVDAPATPAAHSVGTLRGTPVIGRIVRVLSFFTIQSNLLCAAASLRLWRRPDEGGTWWRAVRLAGLFGISVTGLVYATVLSRTHDPNGLAEVATNTVFHYVAPVAAVAGWLLHGPRPRIDSGTVVRSLGWPVAWSTWALVHGALTDWYPYPFVDVTTLGYVRVVVNAVLVVGLLAVVVAIFRFGDRRLSPAPHADLDVTATSASEPSARSNAGRPPAGAASSATPVAGRCAPGTDP